MEQAQETLEARLRRLWNSSLAVITKPSVATFEQEKPRANLVDAVIWVVLGGLIGGIISAIVSISFPSAMMPFGNAFGAVPDAFGVGAIITTPIMSIVFLFIGSAIVFVMSQLLQGKGNFATQTYLMALFLAPLSVVSAVLGAIPWLGVVLSLVVAVYEVVLLTFALQSTHQVSGGRAFLMWFIPAVVLGVLFLCIMIIIGAAVGIALLGT